MPLAEWNTHYDTTVGLYISESVLISSALSGIFCHSQTLSFSCNFLYFLNISILKHVLPLPLSQHVFFPFLGKIYKLLFRGRHSYTRALYNPVLQEM